jgi:hypothetical protein
MRLSRRAAAAGVAAALIPAAALGSDSERLLQASPNPVHAGSHVRVHGRVPGCPAGDQVTLISRAFSHRHEFASVPAVFATVRSDGHFSVRTRIPSTRRPGRYSLSGRCGGGNLGFVRHVRVLRPRA